jgi:hypothetical protein
MFSAHNKTLKPGFLFDLHFKCSRFVMKTKSLSQWRILFDILKITIPAVIVILTAWILINKMIRNDQERRRNEIALQNSRTIVPIRLQAYERIILFLERTSMESLLMRRTSRDDGRTDAFCHTEHHQIRIRA